MGLSRRRLLGLGAAGAVGVATGGVAGAAVASAAAEASDPAPADPVVPFFGAHQSGIATPVQDRLHFAAFDVTAGDPEAIASLLAAWTSAAARMAEGLAAGLGGAIPIVPEAPPRDTGEALDLSPARLTVTVGFGPSLFEREGVDRFGLRTQRPEQLVELPRFAADALDPARSGGDIVIQACADDPQVAVHAVRNLARIGFGTVAVRWSQLGFGKTSSTTPAQATPRNLFGFKDGTRNIAGDDEAALNEHVWVGDEAPAWLQGGSYLVARRISMRIETWDRTSLAEQEAIVGRSKREGAPAGAVRERDSVHLDAMPPDAHVALAHPDSNGGVRMLRRGFSFVDGSDGVGHLDAGLFFLAYVRDPHKQFVPIQARLSQRDVMMEYLSHTGSGVWAVPPGVEAEGEYWGQALFEG